METDAKNGGEFGPELEGTACGGEVNDGPFRCPEHQRASSQEKWIACSERLPELHLYKDGSMSESVPVLAFAYQYGPVGNPSQVVLQLVNIGGETSWEGVDGNDAYLGLDAVTHWRPLPAPLRYLKERHDA